jgi:hypothetical protein
MVSQKRVKNDGKIAVGGVQTPGHVMFALRPERPGGDLIDQSVGSISVTIVAASGSARVIT